MPNDISTIKNTESSFPELLHELAKPPEKLFVRGTMPEGPCFAVIGTRTPTAYGKQITPQITTELVRAGFVIVSGLAYGIDALAHEAALTAGGSTIAVLGTGVDEASLYPRKHIKLARRIVEAGGAIISEYAPGTPGQKHHFPARNRIVSGLSLGVLIVEAASRSGALITARHALDQNRDVFAVPGPITSSKSVGPNMLIQSGATPVLSPKDIIENYGQMSLLPPEQSVQDATKEERQVLDVLAQKALHVDTIAELLAAPAQTILPILTHMELKGLVKNVGGGSYSQS